MHDTMFSDILSRMIEYNRPDLKRINHAMKVFAFAQALCHGEDADAATRLVVGITAILHDIGVHEAERKYGSSAWNYQEQEGPKVAAGLFAHLGLDSAVLERCLYIIGNHHSYDKIDGQDFQLLVEADFMVNIFEGGEKRAARLAMADATVRTKTGRQLLLDLYGTD